MNLLAEPSDEQLFRKAQKGDEAAFTTLYRRRQGGVYRFALQMSGSEAIAEDVVQEVFLALIRDSAPFQESRGALQPYLFGMARNIVLRHLEKSRQHLPLLPDFEVASSQDVQAEASRLQDVEAVRRAILALPEHYREVVVLCDLQELDYESAAIALGCAVGTVRSRLHRARGLLVERLSSSRCVS